MMGRDSRTPWRGEWENEWEAEADAKQDALREWIVEASVSLFLAIEMGMGEAVVESLIDTMWDGLRAKALNPDTVDQVLGIAIHSVTDDARDRMDVILRNMARIPTTEGSDHELA